MMLDDNMRSFGVLLDSLWASLFRRLQKMPGFRLVGIFSKGNYDSPLGWTFVGPWMAEVRWFRPSKMRGLPSKTGISPCESAWNCVKKVRFFNPMDGIGVNIGVSQWVFNLFCKPRPRRKVPKPRALWEPQVLQERPSGASPNHGFTDMGRSKVDRFDKWQ